MTDNRNIVYTLKYLSYFGIFLGLYLIQTMPTFLSLAGIKPCLLIPAAVAVAMHDGEFIGGIFGAVAGLFMDMQQISLFGFNSFILLINGVAVGLVVIYYMQNKRLNFLLLTAAIMMLTILITYFFGYSIWDYDKTWIILIEKRLPTMVYTLLVAPAFYYLFGWLKEYYDSKIRIK